MRICKRVTNQGNPCRNKAVVGTDYCFAHTVSQRRGWTFYIGLIGSLASVVGLVFFFLPPSQQGTNNDLESIKSIPFYMTSVHEDVFSIRGSFEGELQVLPESIEINVNDAYVDYPEKYVNLGNQTVTAITAGLGLRTTGGAWTLTHRHKLPTNINITPGERIRLEGLHFSIPKKSSTDISKMHLIIEFTSLNNEGKEGYTYVHSEDMFNH